LFCWRWVTNTPLFKMDVWLFILGYLIQFVGSCVLLYKIDKHRSIYGLSIDTQICFLIATMSRCFWSLETRLVQETRIAYAELFLSTAASLLLCWYCFNLRHTTTKAPWWPLRCSITVPLTLLLATLFHPGKNFISIQILVAFSMYLESVALVPQLYLMRRMVDIEPLTSLYVVLLIMSRVVRMLFWTALFLQGEHFLGLFLADAIHSVLSVDYLYLWIRKLRNGGWIVFRV